MKISYLDFFTIIAILHCLILSLIILYSKFFKNSNNKYLGFTLLIISIVGINNWFWDIGLNPTIISIEDLFLWQFLYPATYFMFFYKTSKTFYIKHNKLVILYVPFLFFSLINIIIGLDTVFNIYDIPLLTEKKVYFFYKGISIMSILFTAITIILSYREIFNKPNKSNEKWIKYLWIFFSIILLYGTILEVYRFLYSEKLPLTYLWVFSSVLIYWLIYKGLYKLKLLNDQYEVRTILKRAIKKEVASEVNENPYFQKLIVLLEKEKIHHNPNLSRDIVAEQLGISAGYLSQIIKNNTSLSFSDFINSYRIKDVKEMIVNSDFDKYSLLSIGLECGFNSKTSFYSNFKKETNMTPKEFRNK